MFSRVASKTGKPLGAGVLGARVVMPVVLAGLFALPATALLALPAVVQAEAGCPNEQLRVETHSTSLPDCRAYELVTPPFKYGQIVGRPIVTTSGSSVAFVSLGEFNEAANDVTSDGGTYVDSRGVSGWSSLPVSDSAEQFQFGLAFNGGGSSQRGETVDFNPDLSQSLFAAAPISGKPIDFRLYRRTTATGAFTEIGPFISPSQVASWTSPEEDGAPGLRYAGATHDLSHVFYTEFKSLIHSFYWPGDVTVTNSSLYEYSGTDNSEPVLVGVAPGPEEAKARPVEHPELISQCGTLPGSAEGGDGALLDEYNAISTLPASEEGHIVFFTALAKSSACEHEGGVVGPPVDELYARIDGSHTVAISEPSAADCAACVLTSPQQAVFQGASADGSKVFFVSQQELFGGSKGESGNNLYEYNLDAPNPHEKLSFVASGLASYSGGAPLAGVVRVTEDGSRVYFVSEDRGLATNSDAKGRTAVEEESSDNLYVYDGETGRTTFITALSPGDREDWGPADVRPVEATPDGRYLLFSSVNDLTPDSSGTGSQIYRYDAQSGELARISVGEGGFNDNGNDGLSSSIQAPAYNVASAEPSLTDISDDGSKVVFASSGALTPQALNEACALEQEGACISSASNVYEWEGGHVYLLSDGRDTHAVAEQTDVNLIGISASGGDVFFTTADPLVGQDGDTQQDIYDARVGGGFAAPVVGSVCVGESCQGSPSASPVFSASSSAAFAGSGNLLSPPSSSSPVLKPKSAVQARALALAKALRSCRAKRDRRRRSVCEAQARRRYGPKGKRPVRGKRSVHVKRGGRR
jgi:Tol biopolymer transport system component